MTLQKEGKDMHMWAFLPPHYTTGADASAFHPSDFTYEYVNLEQKVEVWSHHPVNVKSSPFFPKVARP